MSDAIPTRDEMEARLARVIAKANRETLNRIWELLGNPPDANKITPQIWAEIQQQYEQTLTPEYEKVFLVGMAIVGLLFTVGVDYAVQTERAAAYARESVRALVADLNAKNQTALNNAVMDYTNGVIDYTALETRLGRLFGAVRADTISITEITRILAAAGRDYAAEVGKQGLRVIGRVVTSADDRVCPICAPKNRADVRLAGYPPYHVRCRCDVRWATEEVNA